MGKVIHVDFVGEISVDDIIEIPEIPGTWKVLEIKSDGLVIVEAL